MTAIRILSGALQLKLLLLETATGKERIKLETEIKEIKEAIEVLKTAKK